MKTARHVDSTNPERVRVMMATGRIEDGRTVIETSRRTTIVASSASRVERHRRLPGHLRETIAWHMRSSYRFLRSEGLSRTLARSFVRTYVHMASLGLGWAPDEKRPGHRADGDTGHGPEESEATSKVADAPAAGNSGRNGRYVVTVGSPGGVVDERFYANFAAMVIGARELAERYPHPDRQIVCGNVDEADIDSDGLSDAERGLLEELL